MSEEIENAISSSSSSSSSSESEEAECEGREGEDQGVPQNFLTENLAPSDVKWFWFKSEDRGSGSDIIPRSEVYRFSAGDSAALEAAFRKRQGDIESVWSAEDSALLALAEKGRHEKDKGGNSKGNLPEEKDKADNDPAPGTEGPSTPCKKGKDPTAYNAKADPNNIWEMDEEPADAEFQNVTVCGGHRDVCLEKRSLKFCYWPGPSHRVIRASWFVYWQDTWAPLGEILADQIEDAFQRKVWRSAGDRVKEGCLEGVKVPLNCPGKTKYYVIICSQTEAYLVKDDGLDKFWRGVTGRKSAGDRLRRGWSFEKVEDYKERKMYEMHDTHRLKEVKALILVTHGIGQLLPGSSIATDCGKMREQITKVVEQHPEEKHSRIEVLPVQWRKNLDLDADDVAARIMPKNIEGLRSLSHQTAVEVLLYLSPLHHRDFVASMAYNLNEIYGRFIRRNPTFKGKVSIAAHSLGSVLCYDVLCHQPDMYRRLAKETSMAEWGSRFDSSRVQKAPPSSGQTVVDEKSPDGVEEAIKAKELLLEGLQNEAEQLKLELAKLKASRQAAIDEQKGKGSSTRGSPRRGPMKTVPSSAGMAVPDMCDIGMLRYPKLDFDVDQFFLLGSPVALFLGMRGVDPDKGRMLGSIGAKEVMPFGGGYGDALPAVRRMYNIYHPYDVIAYRLEPLGFKDSELRRPVYMPHLGGKRLHISSSEFMEDVGSSFQQAGTNISEAFENMKAAIMRQKRDGKTRRAIQLHDEDEEELTLHRLTDGIEDRESKGRGANGRLDFILQAAPMDNPYLTAIGAHFVYFNDPDTALVISRAVSGLDIITGEVKITQKAPGRQRIIMPASQSRRQDEDLKQLDQPFSQARDTAGAYAFA